MADTKYTAEINTKATGDGAEKTTEKLDQLEKMASQAEAAAEHLSKEIDELGDDSSKAAKSIQRQVDALEAVAKNSREAAAEGRKMANTTDKVAGAQKKGNKQTRNSGLAFLEVSRAVEDAQYGLRGVLNNLPQIALHFGLGAGLAGAVSLTAVALATLLPMLGGTKDSMKGLSESVGSVGQAFDDLNDLSDLDDQFKDLKDSIDSQSTAISTNTSKLESNIAARQKLRALKIEELKLEAELKKQEIDARVEDGSISAEEAVLQKGAIDLNLKKAEGLNRQLIAKGELKLLEEKELELLAKKALAEKQFQAAQASDVKEKKKLADHRLPIEKAESRRAASELDDLDLTDGSFWNSALRNIAAATGDTDEPLESDKALLLEAKQIADDRESMGDDPALIKRSMQELMKLAARAQKNKEAAGGDGSNVENNLIEAGRLAKIFLAAEKQVERLDMTSKNLDDVNKEEEKIIEEFPKVQQKIQTEIDKNKALQGVKRSEINAIDSIKVLDEKSLAGKTESEARKQAKVAAKKAAAEELRRNKERLKELEEEQLTGGKVIAGEAGRLSRNARANGKTGASAALGTVSDIFADGKVGAAENSPLAKVMADLKKSQLTKDSEVIKTMTELIQENNQKTAEIKNLRGTIKKQETQRNNSR